jgi:hypothetical protein
MGKFRLRLLYVRRDILRPYRWATGAGDTKDGGITVIRDLVRTVNLASKLRRD